MFAIYLKLEDVSFSIDFRFLKILSRIICYFNNAKSTMFERYTMAISAGKELAKEA